MNGSLWKLFLEDDVDGFVAALHGEGHTKQSQSYGMSYGSPYDFPSSSPTASFKTRHPERTTPTLRPQDRQGGEHHLSRAEINWKDNKGRTLLHHAASLPTENAAAFALALISHPLVDLYIQDLENGWTALHRAFYFGNISIARAIIERESQSIPGQSGASTLGAPLLIAIKDREGLAPYDLLSSTIADRTLRHQEGDGFEDDRSSEDEDNDGRGREVLADGDELQMADTEAFTNVKGDEIFTFGSNRNISLGVGDGDDRQFPERIALHRPDYLFKQFHREYAERQAEDSAKANLTWADRIRDQAKIPQSAAELPNVIRSTPVRIREVQMSKYHTAILTNDPSSNLHICGHGPGGRLGLGNEKTLFNFVPIEDWGGGRKKIAAVALGQDHTLAVTDSGELFTWGSNAFGQLGSGAPKENAKPEECIVSSPKQLFGPLKREWIVGVAASRIHSVAYTATALFTFGKNEGQLGLVDSQAGSLKMQATPRQVQASRLSSSAIHSVSAIDRATIVLMENHEVHVFANYGAVRLQFPLNSFSNYFNGSMRATSYENTPNQISKITAGGDTICAMSSAGEVFTVNVSHRLDPGSASTTNPNKIKAALSTPFRVWALRSDRMLARDVGVDADGSVILSTSSGSVWRRVRRTKAAQHSGNKPSESRIKDFKFMRVPNMTRAVAVRASASGSYAAIRQECDVTRDQQAMPAQTGNLLNDTFALLSFKELENDSEIANPAPAFWTRAVPVAKMAARLFQAPDVEDEVATILRQRKVSASEDLLVATTTSDIRIPAHIFLFTARSSLLRLAFGTHRAEGAFENDIMRLSSDVSGKTVLTFLGVDFLTILELVLFVYADKIIGFWQQIRRSPELAYRYRQVAKELSKLGLRLELQNLESAARRQVARPERSLHADMEMALLDQSFFSNGDALVQLADGELLIHSVFMAKRCPFFEGLFQGQAGGHWLAGRRANLEDPDDVVSVDLSNVELHIFKLVLRYLYCDTGPELFDNVVTKDLNEFLDLVLDVLSVANELMLDRLAEICQFVLGRYVNTRNACQLLNDVAPCSVTTLKTSILDYICLNLEAMLTNRLLDELDEDLLFELDNVVRENQLTASPFVKSGRAEEELLDRHPELAALIIRARQAKIDAIMLQGKFPDINTPVSKPKTSPVLRAKVPSATTSPNTPAKSPSIRAELAMSNLEPLPSPVPLDLPPPRTPQATARPIEIRPVSAEKPWGSSHSPQVAKPSMRDIMSQTSSSSKPSNIALGLQLQSDRDRASATQSPRVSQKERKRQQQQLRGDSSLLSSPQPAPTTTSSASSSPWKTVATPKRASIPAMDIPKPDMARKASVPDSRSPATPQLTMRQTVANAAAPKADATKPASPIQQQRRSVSTPQASVSKPTCVPNDGPGMAIGTSAAIPIQSVRHTRRPDSSAGVHMHQSLADIISKEQADRKAAQDSVAKRSLQEIQEEQAFQEWWDKESRAVQEEEAVARASSSPRGGRGGRQRGRGRRGGKQRAAQSSANDTQ